jgi:hypothetical protein
MLVESSGYDEVGSYFLLLLVDGCGWVICGCGGYVVGEWLAIGRFVWCMEGGGGMGRRFLAVRYPLDGYSSRRVWLRLHEGDFEPHRMRPYGLGSGKFSYRQMFQKKHQSRLGNRLMKRAVKKAARRLARYEL